MNGYGLAEWIHNCKRVTWILVISRQVYSFVRHSGLLSVKKHSYAAPYISAMHNAVNLAYPPDDNSAGQETHS